MQKEREISSLKLQLEEAEELAAIKEKILKAEIKEMERVYKELSKRLEEIRIQSYEIRVLKALNEIIATASKSLSLNDVLEPTLKVIITSLESFEGIQGSKAKITGGIFLLNEESKDLLLSASHGISSDSLGCKGNVAVGDCICGLAAQTGKIDATPFCFADKRHTRMSSVHPEENHAHISIPIKSGDKVLGVIFLYFSPPGYKPQPSDIIIFASIGNYLGVQIENARLYEKVYDLSIRDGLTMLYNSREFYRLLKQEIQRAKRYEKEFSLMMIDIDHFKKFNDTYGHPAGDKALRALGDIIRKHIRSIDIAARYGGEEFAIFLPEISSMQAEEVGERLRLSVADHTFSIGGKVVSLTISIGLASFPSDSNTGDGLVKAADQALYCTKNSGRNRVYRFIKG